MPRTRRRKYTRSLPPLKWRKAFLCPACGDEFKTKEATMEHVKSHVRASKLLVTKKLVTLVDYLDANLRTQFGDCERKTFLFDWCLLRYIACLHDRDMKRPFRQTPQDVWDEMRNAVRVYDLDEYDAARFREDAPALPEQHPESWKLFVASLSDEDLDKVVDSVYTMQKKLIPEWGGVGDMKNLPRTWPHSARWCIHWALRAAERERNRRPTDMNVSDDGGDDE